ncbi:hypothetical protein M3661_05010, partial [Paenibacillus sp. MER 180]|uniref:hypothetical protein n=1 Tax=Paenibacillus sp. MER 180 TaxID=2939570 RepID=UPI00203F50BC
RCTTCNFTSNDTGLLLDIRKTPIIVAVEVLFFLLSTMMGAYQKHRLCLFFLKNGDERAWERIITMLF